MMMKPPMTALSGIKQNQSVGKAQKRGLGLGAKIGLGLLSAYNIKKFMAKGALGLTGKFALGVAGIKIGNKVLDIVKDKMTQGKMKRPTELLLEGKDKAGRALAHFDKSQDAMEASMSAQNKLTNAIEAPSMAE